MSTNGNNPEKPAIINKPHPDGETEWQSYAGIMGFGNHNNTVAVTATDRPKTRIKAGHISDTVPPPEQER